MKKIITLCLLAIIGTTTVNAQCTANTWTIRTSAANNAWRAVTYGNGLFVAVSFTAGNQVMTSPDGINWTSRTIAVDKNWTSVTYGNGVFVAVAYNSVMTSPDGITWTFRTAAASNSWQNITYGNGLFVTVSSDGNNRVMTSPDGINWTSRTSSTNNTWQYVTYGNGLFVAVAQSGTGNIIMTSPDGITWTSRTPAAFLNFSAITYGNGLFVIVAYSGTGNRVMTSPDGIAWTSRSSAADNAWTSVTYGNGLFVAVAHSGTGNRVMTSPDGITWTSRTSALDNYWQSITYGNGLFVATAQSGTDNRVMTSQVFTTSTTNASICPSALPYNWNGSRTTAGTYTFTTTNSVGCDSVATLNLIVKTLSNSTANVSICPSALPYSWNGTRTAAGTYKLTTTNSQGCDSVATLNLILKANTTSTTNISVCPSQLPYSWNGNRAAAGTYTFATTNSLGCDSVATLNLTINQVTNSITNVSVCSNQLPYSWNGRSYNNAGTYIKTGLVNANSCDSSATLNLTVLTTLITPSVSISTPSTTVCSGNNVSFTASSTTGGSSPIFQWKRNGGNVGSGSSINFLAGTLTSGNVISCVMTANNGCQTTATTNSNLIALTVKQSPSVAQITNGISVITTASLCTLSSTFKYFNVTPYGTWSSTNESVASVTGGSQAGVVKANANGTATVSYNITATNGCVSTSTLLLTVAQQTAPTAISGINSICMNATTTLSSTAPFGTVGVWTSLNDRGTINVNGAYTGANAGTGQARYTVTNAAGCSAYSNYSVTVNSTPVVPTITYAAGTVGNPQVGAPTGSFCVGKKFRVAGTPNVPLGVWSATGSASIAGNDTIKINVVGVGSVKYTYTSAAGCSNSRTMSGNGFTCAARGTIGDEQLAISNYFTMYPNPAKTFISLNVETLVGVGSIVVTDLYGKQVKNQALSIGTNTVDIANLNKGIYFFSLITSEGKTTKKLVVE